MQSFQSAQKQFSLVKTLVSKSSRSICLGLLLLFGDKIVAQSALAGNPPFKWDNTFTELDFRSTIQRTQNLNRQEKTALVSAVAARIRPSKNDLEIASESELQSLSLQSRVKLIDLNEDGQPEVIVQPVGMKTGCGATGNCPFWVFAKTERLQARSRSRRNSDVSGRTRVPWRVP